VEQKYETNKLRGVNSGANLKENEIEDLRKQINDLKMKLKKKIIQFIIWKKKIKINKMNVKTKKK